MRRTLPALLLAGLAAFPVYPAEDDATSLSYIAYMERYATVDTAAGEGSLEAQINMPVLPGDRIDSAREARLEVVLADGSTVWLDEYTSVAFDAIAFSRGSDDGRTVLFLADGAIVVQIPATALLERPTRVDARSATVHLTKPGLYRLEALPSGGLRVEAWEGLAEVATPAGGVLVRAGTAVEASGREVLRTEAVLTRDDRFARWVMDRLAPPEGEASRRLEARYGREGAVLDRYGTWIYLDDLGTWAWRPDVAGAWSPYWYGRWYWTPAGWTWISYEPWGWIPYHYGSWYFDVSLGWVWFWDPVWGPAWVDWIWWPGYIGWCPRGYYDWWWWGRGWDWTPPSRGRTRPGGGGALPRPSGRVRPLPDGGSRALADHRPGDRDRVPRLPARFALDLAGEARLDRIDGGPWRVVRVDDFASPHLPRLARPLDDVRRETPGTVARVVSGPLVTPPPGRSRTGAVVEGALRAFPVRRGADLTPLLERRGDLDPARLGDAVRPADPARLLRERVGAAGRGGSPTAGRRRPVREATHDRPNVHRPYLSVRPPRTAPGDTSRRVTPPARTRSPYPRTAPRTDGGRYGAIPRTAPRAGSGVRPRPPAARPGAGWRAPAPRRPPVRPRSSWRPTVRLPSRPAVRLPSRPSRPSLRSVPRRSGPPARVAPGRATTRSRPVTRPRGG